MLLIPSIDVRGGHCVRLFKGDFAAETIYASSPIEVAQGYASRGARWLHLVDLDGARDGELTNRSALTQMTGVAGLSVQVGGGVRQRATVDELLALGVARVVVGSAAVEQPNEVAAWLREYGPERVCLAFDVRLDQSGVPQLQTRGWREATTISLFEAVERFAAHGLRHVLCTDIDRDGALGGPNVELYRQCVERFPTIAWQASGGVRDSGDLHALDAAGAAAAISGKALLEGRIDAQQMRQWLKG
jgi:phosphoribosylformimino-5-aminoimidazole carboxamide ribotide isomerase